MHWPPTSEENNLHYDALEREKLARTLYYQFGKNPSGHKSNMILEHEGEYLIVIPHSWVSIRKLLLPSYDPTFIIIIIFEILKPRWRDVMETIYSFQSVDIA